MRHGARFRPLRHPCGLPPPRSGEDQEMAAPHPKTAIRRSKKRCPTLFRCASLHLGSFNLQAKAVAAPVPDAAKNRPPSVRRTRQIGRCTRLNFPELWHDDPSHAPTGSRPQPGITDDGNGCSPPLTGRPHSTEFKPRSAPHDTTGPRTPGPHPSRRRSAHFPPPAPTIRSPRRSRRPSGAAARRRRSA